MMTQLKLPPETVKNITLHRVYRLSKRQENRSRPIVAKFEHFKHEGLIKSKGKELKAPHTTFGLNDQYPREINDRS